ncbi:PLxRFG domain-containing protein [Acinetobacter defluvii]|uniref:PLxRFG domain-containing protein n=1 Tax=Acinetobacter defluvii TaxID=1871111 RepID=A0A2S2FEG4_9GAMM|nr:PLxRFG domain-containing protein [Acinetobacter defluvii]AWL29334.1 PLxRFG domain-containing protein [Acinetobacter defluvii]
MSDTQDKNKSKPSFDPTTAKPVDTPLVAKSEGFNFDPSSAKETKKSKTDLIKDTGASLAAGIARIPDTLIGIGDIYTEGRLGRDIDKSDVYKTGEGQKYWEDKKSDISKEQEKTRQNIDGIWNKTKYVLENPSQITNAVVGSLPDMALGMGIGRASKIANPIVAASVGEGAVMAGAQAEGIRQQSDDQLLNNGQEAAAFGTGVIGGSLGAFGGWVANKVFKVADVDTALQTGRLTREQIGEATSQVKAKDIPLSIIKGAFSEGFLEELPQSVSEQIIQNLALDKPWNDSIEDAAVMGTLAGMAMGGTVSGVGKTMDWMNNPRSNISPQQDQIEPNNTESVGSVTPELGYNGLQGEYIPRADQVDPQQAQARYTYDQQSTDAENRLNFDNRNDLSGAMDNNDNPTGPDTPPTPNGNYFDRPNTYASIDQPPSQQMGIDPNNGPLSTAAALSVDSGASQIITTPTEQSTESTNSMLTDAAIEDNLEAQPTAQNEYTDPTAQDIQHGMSEIAKGAKEGALENTIQRLEKDGEVQLFKEDSIAKALEDQNYNVRLNDDGSASIIGVKNPATNQWHGQGKTDLNQPETSITEAQPKQIEVSQQLATLQQRFDEAKTVPEKARIRKEINALQQNHETPQGVNSSDIQSTNGAENSTSQLPNSARVDSTTTESSPEFNAENVQPTSKNASNLPTKINSDTVSVDDSRKIQNINNLNTTEITASASENNISMPKNTILDAQNNIDITQTNNVVDQLTQLEQQFLDAKSVPQKAKLKKQIDQLKSQQTEITTTPFGSEQIQKQYGDTAESVMSDIEILGDDFTIDLRDKNKKTNALNNPNYNAVQKADGSVEIVGMKHPTTGEWVGKKPSTISIEESAQNNMSESTRWTKHPTRKKTWIADNDMMITDESSLGKKTFYVFKDRSGYEQGDFLARTESLRDAKQKAVNILTKNSSEKLPKNTKLIESDPVTQPKNFKDSIENIRAEKIRQKDLADMHNSVYGLASDEQLQQSLKHLNKEIAKAQKQSENEVVNGKRSTRKAVAAGALDRFLKNRVDLETYIKARKNGELKQRNKKIDDYSRDKLKPDNERKGASPLSTLFSPLPKNVVDRLVTDILLRITKGSTPSGAKSVVNRVVQPKFPFIVVESFEALPEAIQQDNYYQDKDGNTQRYEVSAVWHKGTLYINAGDVQGNHNTQQTTYEAYEEVLLHEVVGHFGVQQLFGKEYKVKFQQLFNALGGVDGVRKIAKENGVDMDQFENAYLKPFKKGVDEGLYDPLDAQQATVSELFAFIAQNAKSRPFVRQKLKEVIGYIRQWFRDRGFDKFLSRYNDADLMMFLSEARKAVVDRSYFGKYKNQEFSSKNNSNTPLYSRRTKSNSGSTTQQVRDVLIDRFGKETIDELERQGKLEIIQDYQVEGVEGFYYKGKAVLVASNLTAESTVPTFLHELGGHAGFQNMMNQKQYNELMNQFNKLVEQGNPVALAAKMLAEREQGSERQQLEYLPYLLTLSATMQQRNVLQRNALQKLINNIISYVKAWVFDHFGINLNLNPDDMLALSERMIGQIKHQSSLDLVRQKYHGTNQWMKAPNGAATHLSEQQWLQVRTPEFKKWFGDWENDAANASQVLDENGEPKVVYHGTATEFNEFKQGHGLLGDGIYLTDSFDTADVYANIRGENGFVLPLFVNIRNAFKTTGNVSREEVVEATTSGKYQGIVHQFENQEYIVALEPNQVKMAEGNKGTFNSESSDIRFSRSSNYDDITNRIANGFKNLPKTGDWINKKGVDWLKFGLQALSRRHLTEIYGKLLPPLNKYNELAAQMDADKNDIAAEADNIVREWSKLKDEEALANVMHDATLAQIDPAKPYQQGDNKVKYQQLLHAYNNLSPEAQAMYKKARNAYSGHYAKVREAIRERILRSALSSQKKADLLQKIEGSFGQIKGVYFPLARFGKYVVVLRNQNGEAEVVSRAETKNEAESVRAELIKKYPQYKADDVKKDAEFNASRDSVGRGFMSDLFDEVGNLGLDAKSQADFEDTLSQLYLSSMPDLSWAKHGIHRKGTAGFSNDARRAFAQHMFSGANYLGKLRYGDQLAQQLDEMKKYSEDQFKKGVGYDQNSANDVIDEMEKRHELLMNPKGNPLSSFLTSVGFMYYMGLSPAAAMVNLSQTALIAYPIMGAKWGFDKAGKELLKASQDFGIGLKSGYKTPDFSSLEGFKNSVGDIYNPDIASILKGDELVAYEEAVKRGVIDVTQAHDLAGIAQGEDSKVMWYFRPAMRLASGMFHHAERFNREVTFIAAYRLARQHVNTNGSKATHSEAFEQAIDAVYKGHFDYSTGNRARFMQGNIAKVVLLFKQYAQNMIYTLVRNAHQSIYALDPKEQKEARRALAGILGMTTLAAGAIGLPITGMLFTASILIAKKSKLGSAAFFAAWAVAFFGAADGDEEDPYELEIVIRNWLADIHPKFADLVFGGVPRVFSPVDLSGRVGLNNLIIPDVQEGLEGADWATAMQSALLGPVVGISTSTVKGLQQIQEGDYGRGIETMLPIFLKNAMKSYRYADEGVLTKNKDVIHDKDVTGVELFSQAIGFSPASVRTSYEGRSAIFQYRTKLEDHRRELMRKWVVARQEDDSDGMNKVWTEILEFNAKTAEKNPKMRISRMNLMQSYKATERKAKETGDGGVYLTKRQKGAEEQGGFAFNR